MPSIVERVADNPGANPVLAEHRVQGLRRFSSRNKTAPRDASEAGTGEAQFARRHVILARTEKIFKFIHKKILDS